MSLGIDHVHVLDGYGFTRRFRARRFRAHRRTAKRQQVERHQAFVRGSPEQLEAHTAMRRRRHAIAHDDCGDLGCFRGTGTSDGREHVERHDVPHDACTMERSASFIAPYVGT